MANNDGVIIPIVEDDMGEGVKEVIDDGMTQEEIDLQRDEIRNELLRRMFHLEEQKKELDEITNWERISKIE